MRPFLNADKTLGQPIAVVLFLYTETAQNQSNYGMMMEEKKWEAKSLKKG
jgi:hypothetical protein